MRGIRIIDPGMHSSIQDKGREGYRQFGMPLSGVMDQHSFYLANWLVRNSLNEAAIETTFHGFEVEFLCSAIFSITGGNTTPQKNGESIENWRSYRAKRGDVVTLKASVTGARSYLSINGGFRIDQELESLSTYIPGNIGGYRGRSLRSDDIISLYPSVPFLTGKRSIPDHLIPDFSGKVNLKVLPGVNFDLFEPNQKDSFFDAEFIVSQKSDRMGLRLVGRKIELDSQSQVISYGIHPGAIQIPNSGEPIIMGSDCQTVGGYPQIANIISADLPKLGQLKPGDSITFKLTDIDSAIEELKQNRSLLTNLFGAKGPAVCTDCMEKRR